MLPLRLLIKSNHDLLKIIYAGVNASYAKFSSGSYLSGSKQEISSRLPFAFGIAGVGLIAAVGDRIENIKIGSSETIMTFGAYAEFTLAHSSRGKIRP
ncbi:Alcohol dehydrogenase GroES-like protein [Cynara cardunculus var. scolymus]|uniref:Alcohol dehydrogenase GroES-like protein n=1 Tax=Cynara cardunculus var. scolymus TaxID=59895 RepID=A0A124SAN3_CYNCS|nr:Alcohol dehydrogenase GroES-like protein [Cynara cardunculus var. scolymus]